MPITNEPVLSLISKAFKTDKKSKATGKNEKTGVSNSSKPNPPRTEKKKEAKKPTKKLEKREIKVSEPEKQQRAEALADKQLRDVLRALLQGKASDARSTMEGISNSLQKIAKNSPDPDAFVRDFCRKSLTPDLAPLPDSAIMDMAQQVTTLLAKAPNDPVFAQVNFSVKSELLARSVRALAGQGIDPARGDTDGLSTLHETQLQALRGLAREVAGLAKDVAPWKDELAAKQLPWTALQRLRKQVDDACESLQAQRQEALAFVSAKPSTTIADMPPAELGQWVRAVEVLSRSIPQRSNGAAEDFVRSDSFRLMKQEIADAEDAIVQSLKLGDLSAFDVDDLADDELAELHSAMTQLKHVPKSIRKACNEVHIAIAGRTLARVEGKTVRHASLAEVETLVSYVAVLLPVAKSAKDFSNLQQIGQGLMQVAVAGSASATSVAARANLNTDRSTAALVTAVDREAAAKTAARGAKPKSKAQTKVDAAAAEVQAAKANVQHAATHEVAAKQAAAHAKKVAAEAVQVADRVTAAWAKAHPQVQTTQTL